MSVKKFPVKLVSYGRYTRWDANSKDLPELLEFTHTIAGELGVEFGYVVNVKKARRETLEYEIRHPTFHAAEGAKSAPFTGSVRIPSNDYLFFIGDTLWEPLWDKFGPWRMILKIRGQVVADETFDVEPVGVEAASG